MMDIKMNAATERTLVEAIKSLGGIADAQIISHKRPEWERNVWARKNIVSVSVSVEAIDNKPLPHETITAIGNIIAPAFGITNRKEIGIVDARHSKSYDGLGDEVGSAQGAYLRHATRAQNDLNRRIYEHLPKITGLSVETTVVLTDYLDRQTFNVQHDKPTPLVTHVMGYDFLKEGWDRFFRPGQIAQFSRTQIDPGGDMGPRDKIKETKHESETTNALQGTETKEDLLPYIPKSVTASIQIPYEYVLEVWQGKNRLRGNSENTQPTDEQFLETQDEITQTTKRTIAKLLESYRLSNKTDPMELVEVTYFYLMPPVEPELTAWEQFVLFMKENWQNIGLMSLVFCGITVLWLISKPQKPDNIVIYEGLETPLDAIDARIAEKIRREEEAAAAEAAAAAAAAAEQEEFENSLGDLGSIRSLKDEIAELIRQNPDAAAAIIRQWIGNAVLVEAKS
jgi:flagellar M-ring protein FliF